MKFSTRNAFYLRASNYRVIPLFLYLDERHVDWMSDRVLQLVIGELQPKMPELLMNAKIDKEKKHKVYVERGDTYQYCYFLRTTTRTEVVLLKQKTFSLRPPTPPPRSTPLRTSTPTPRKGLRQPKQSPHTPRTSRIRSRSVSVRHDDREESLMEVDGEYGAGPSTDVEDEGNEMDIKEWKPDVELSYKGFGTSSLQLVLIIEPYPPLPSSQYAPPTSRLSSRSTSRSTSRSRQTSGLGGKSTSIRYSSMSRSIAPDHPSSSRQITPAANMRDPTNSRSNSTVPVPNSRNGGSVTPFARGESSTPGPGAGLGGRSETPLFLREDSATPTLEFGDTPFGQEDEDEEAHEAYLTALREGRYRLPSVSVDASGSKVDEAGRRSVRRSREEDEEDEEGDDLPESLEAMSGRLVRSSQIEEGILRVQGGWEERGVGEESAVMGKEEPGE